MELLFVGAAGFAIGVVLIVVGRTAAAREAARQRGLGPEALKPFLEWLLGVVKREWPILTGAHQKAGERVAAAGALLTAISLVAMVGGVIAAVAQSVT